RRRAGGGSRRSSTRCARPSAPPRPSASRRSSTRATRARSSATGSRWPTTSCRWSWDRSGAGAGRERRRRAEPRSGEGGGGAGVGGHRGGGGGRGGGRRVDEGGDPGDGAERGHGGGDQGGRGRPGADGGSAADDRALDRSVAWAPWGERQAARSTRQRTWRWCGMPVNGARSVKSVLSFWFAPCTVPSAETMPKPFG